MTALRLISFIFILCGLTSCTPIYVLINKQKVKENDLKIRELSGLISNNNYKEFFSRLTINNDNFFSAFDTLGFGYYKEIDNRFFNDELWFGTTTIKFNDSIISMSVYPQFFGIRPIMQRHYKRQFIKAGWQINRGNRYDFESKILGFHNSILPIADESFTYRPEPNLNIDSLMSPLVYTEAFDRLKDSLTENDLLYLLHSTNPKTRTIVIKHIKCNKIKTDNKTDDWIREVIKNSPQLLTRLSQCVFDYKPIEYFLDCK